MPQGKSDTPTSAVVPVTVDQAITSTEVLLYLKDPDSVALESFQAPAEEVAQRITERNLAAGSAEELFGERKATPGKSYLNKPFQIRSVSWILSDFDEPGSLPIYALMEVTDYDGQLLTLTCGARNVVEKVAIAEQRGWLEYWVKLVQRDRETKAGYKPLDLVSAPAPFPAA